MSHKKKEKETYIEYPEVEVLTEEEVIHERREEQESEKEPETIRLTRFHFLMILLGALFILGYRLVKCGFAGFFAFLGAFRNAEDNANFSLAYDSAKAMFWRCFKIGLGVLVPSWGARFLQ